MFRLVICFLYLAGFLIYNLPKLGSMKKLNRRMEVVKRDQIIHRIPKQWSKVMMKLTGSTISVEGQDRIPEGPVIFISNHEGDFDIPVLLAAIEKPFGFVSKIEVKKVPILSSWMEVMNCVFINRKDRSQSTKAIRDAVRLLKKGHSLVIFPEGTRSKGGLVKHFKSGGFRMAVDAKVPIVPISIIGTSDIFEKNNRLIKPAKVKVIIGHPVVSHIHSEKDIKELGLEVREIIVSEIEKKKIAS
ncbi:lysophospholipid acyltransferase family protein [Neobacillus sp. D3-1R]|uniref:lysophospholipid acyltransferase family protein n=1 Tax=Neobacillus sp. D3-1R TaxID=3445778 RepID=UPI003F9FA496